MEFNSLFLLLIYSSIFVNVSICQDPTKAPKEADPGELLFQRLFKKRRLEQLDAVKDLVKIGGYEKQYKMVTMVAEKVFDVIRASRAVLESSGYIPGVSNFPNEKAHLDALSNILENTALFGEIVLRLPDIVEKVLKTQNEWSVLFEWGLGFAKETSLLDKPTTTLLELVAMEMNITERSSYYVNPHRVQFKKNSGKKDGSKESGSDKKKKKKVLKKGPKMSMPFKNEL